MRYYKYNLEYYYTGYEDSETTITSATTTEPPEDYIIWNPITESWEEEPVDIISFAAIQYQYKQENVNYGDD